MERQREEIGMILLLESSLSDKPIQCRAWESTDSTFYAKSHSGWNFQEYEYRVKPEPLEFWLNLYPSGSICPHKTLEEANRHNSRGRTIKVREVTDE